MKTLSINITKGDGAGPNSLAAFDAALTSAGVQDRNLVRLSSVIPSSSKIVIPTGVFQAPGEWGDILYVVYAAQWAHEAGEEAWASVGWVQDSENGHGLFVEHEAASKTAVEAAVEDSLEALCKHRNLSFDTNGKVTHGALSDGTTTCALVVATFESGTWKRG